MVYGSCINRHKQGINLDNPHECSMVLKGEGGENPNTLVGPSVRKLRGVSSFARDHQSAVQSDQLRRKPWARWNVWLK